MAWSGGRRLFITLTQGTAKEKEDWIRCGISMHELIFSLTQGILEDQ
jgi:hypothetical protein